MLHGKHNTNPAQIHSIKNKDVWVEDQRQKMCKTECKLERWRHTLSLSETDLHFVGIPSDSQGLVCSSGHGVILNHYHLHSCSLLQGYNQTDPETHIIEFRHMFGKGQNKQENIHRGRRSLVSIYHQWHKPVHPAAVWQKILKYPLLYHQTPEQLLCPGYKSL